MLIGQLGGGFAHLAHLGIMIEPLLRIGDALLIGGKIGGTQFDLLPIGQGVGDGIAFLAAASFDLAVMVAQQGESILGILRPCGDGVRIFEMHISIASQPGTAHGGLGSLLLKLSQFGFEVGGFGFLLLELGLGFLRPLPHLGGFFAGLSDALASFLIELAEFFVREIDGHFFRRGGGSGGRFRLFAEGNDFILGLCLGRCSRRFRSGGCSSGSFDRGGRLNLGLLLLADGAEGFGLFSTQAASNALGGGILGCDDGNRCLSGGGGFSRGHGRRCGIRHEADIT